MKSVIIFDAYTLFEDGSVLGRRSKELKYSLNHKGYPFLTFVDNNSKRHTKSIHRLVAENFLPNPDNLSDVNHIDCNRANFKISNLEWMTHGKNIEYSYKMNKRSALGINNARCTTDEETVHEICDLLRSGLLSSQIRDLGFNYYRVQAIKCKKNWKHISDQYF